MELFTKAKTEQGLSKEEMRQTLHMSLQGIAPRQALIVPPDYTRFHSNAGFIANVYYHMLINMGCHVDVLPALGTHEPMTPSEITQMYGDIPIEQFIVHHWRESVMTVGTVPAAYMTEITEGLWTEAVDLEVNRLIMDQKYDLILSVGQVVPHEVIGMANHAKNLFVGVGGSQIINKSHMVGAIYGMERMMGKDHTPVRKMLDYGMEHFMQSRPILFALTVTTASKGVIRTHGLFVGNTRGVLEGAVALSQKKNIDFVDTGLKKCVVYLDPSEFKSTWLGNKAIYRTRMAMADGGELVVLAPGVARFGEDPAVDLLIRKYGYQGRQNILEQFHKPENQDLRNNMGAAAHLIHGSSDERFTITYAVQNITQQEIASVGFMPASYTELAERYSPTTLQYGYNTLPDGEVVYFVPNPALGLWINRENF